MLVGLSEEWNVSKYNYIHAKISTQMPVTLYTRMC